MGRPARLDWRETEFKVRGWVDHELPDKACRALRGVHWTTSWKTESRKAEHVNIKEARALKCGNKS
jgi:hypothetical protein